MNWAAMITEIIDSGITQAEIAKRVGYSSTWVRKVLLGEISDVSWASGQTLIKLSKQAKRKVKN